MATIDCKMERQCRITCAKPVANDLVKALQSPIRTPTSTVSIPLKMRGEGMGRASGRVLEISLNHLGSSVWLSRHLLGHQRHREGQEVRLENDELYTCGREPPNKSAGWTEALSQMLLVTAQGEKMNPGLQGPDGRCWVFTHLMKQLRSYFCHNI